MNCQCGATLGAAVATTAGWLRDSPPKRHAGGRKALGQCLSCLLLLAKRAPCRLQLAAAALAAQLCATCGLAGKEAFRASAMRSRSRHGQQRLLSASGQGGRRAQHLQAAWLEVCRVTAGKWCLQTSRWDGHGLRSSCLTWPARPAQAAAAGEHAGAPLPSLHAALPLQPPRAPASPVGSHGRPWISHAAVSP